MNIYLCLMDGTRKCFKVHRLVMNTFCPIENSEELQVNHINGHKDDNRLENLEWCTRSENLIHAFKTGLEERPKGEKNPRHKLTAV
ncbi:MAG: HNH endonuclease [Lachnospiraceae bacterium]|nr:HNH endonuclease [Lachnospiraceae bacterium]